MSVGSIMHIGLEAIPESVLPVGAEARVVISATATSGGLCKVLEALLDEAEVGKVDRAAGIGGSDFVDFWRTWLDWANLLVLGVGPSGRRGAEDDCGHFMGSAMHSQVTLPHISEQESGDTDTQLLWRSEGVVASNNEEVFEEAADDGSPNVDGGEAGGLRRALSINYVRSRRSTS
ncbi:hypothetical protein [Citricoccus muralis]|uniref:Uncharacterized protein n=1 Tax=Citricoccus muralis TaxID=169134 RepID=A0ABY8H9A1_9MICC|nr:hypothetical protein [Citricoccus muralis]WFP17192.1 hypothetical protein P8192_03445 [Citricoccus muralis]